MTRDEFIAKLRDGVSFGKDAHLYLPLLSPDAQPFAEAIESHFLWALDRDEDIRSGIQSGNLTGQPGGRITGVLRWTLVTDRALLRIEIEGNTEQTRNRVKTHRVLVADVSVLTIERSDATSEFHKVTLRICGEDDVTLTPREDVVATRGRDQDKALLHFITTLREVIHAARKR